MARDQNLLVHLNKEECKYFDELQGGMRVIPVDDQFINQMASMGISIPEGQIRDYRPLAEVIDNPDIKEIFALVISNSDSSGNPSKELKRIASEEAAPKFVDVPEDNPKLKYLAKEGRRGDTEIVYMPQSVCDFLDELKDGPPSTNPKTGFPEYSWWKKILPTVVRVIGTVGGAILGGPIGAGLGRAGAGMLTGEKPKEALKQGVVHGAGAFGLGAAGALGAGLGAGVGGLATGQNPMEALQTGMRGGLYGLGAQTMGAGGIGPFGSLGSSLGFGGNAAGSAGGTLPTIAAQNVGKNAVQSLATQGSTPASGGFFGGTGLGLNAGTLLPVAATLYGANMLQKGRKEELQAWKDENARVRAEKAEMRRKYGMDVDLPGLESINEEIPENDERSRFSYYKKGGKISKGKHDLSDYVSVSEAYKGKTKGQADVLKKDLPQKAYIANATATAHIGDGNTPAGLGIFKKFEDEVQKYYKGARVNKKMGSIKAKTSDGEYQFSPLTVTLLGDGNNSLGADRLDSAIARLMKEKASNGAKLPPKAKPFEAYFV